MARKDKELSPEALKAAQDTQKRLLAYLDQNKSTPVNQKEVARRLEAVYYDLTVVCSMRGWNPLARLETFRNLGYFVP